MTTRSPHPTLLCFDDQVVRPEHFQQILSDVSLLQRPTEKLDVELATARIRNVTGAKVFVAAKKKSLARQRHDVTECTRFARRFPEPCFAIRTKAAIKAWPLSIAEYRNNCP